MGAFDLAPRAWNENDRTHEVRLSETAIATPHLLNEFRFDYKYRPKLAVSGSHATAILVNGFFNNGGAQIERNDQERYLEFQDLVSYENGKHSLRGGVVVKAKNIHYMDRSNFGGTLRPGELPPQPAFAVHRQPRRPPGEVPPK